MVRTGVPSTRFPTPLKGAGATDYCSDSSLIKTIAMIMAIIILCILALAVEGVMSMLAALAVNLAAHFAIVVGSRIEGIAVFTALHFTSPGWNKDFSLILRYPQYLQLLYCSGNIERKKFTI